MQGWWGIPAFAEHFQEIPRYQMEETDVLRVPDPLLARFSQFGFNSLKPLLQCPNRLFQVFPFFPWQWFIIIIMPIPGAAIPWGILRIVASAAIMAIIAHSSTPCINYRIYGD